MGSSYSNITLQGPERDRIIQALEARGRQAYVGPATGGFVVVFDELSEDDPDLGADLARELSAELRGVALHAQVYDDDIFMYTLLRDGELADQYNSHPGYFEGGESQPEGGNAALLASVFGSGDQAAVERILRHPPKTGDYFFETARHGELFEVLGLPEHAVGLGFGYVYQGEADELEAELARVGFDENEAEGPDAQEQLRRARILRAPGGAEAMAHLDAAAATVQGPAHGYFRALLAGDAAAVRALFEGEPVLDDPVSGRVEGGAAVDAHVAAAHARFAGAPLHYMANPTLIESAERVVAHGQLVGRVEGEMMALPCACVWERGEGGGFRELRAYWSPAGLKSQRAERAPILPPHPDLPLPEPIGQHLAALAADDLPGVIGTYDETCLAPVPVWNDPEDTARRHYGAQVGQQGAVVLTPCAVTGSGDRCAVEFVTNKWDGADVPAQAGLAVYELRGGKVCQVHLFGDLAPSPTAGMGALGGLGGGMGGLGALGGMGGLGALGGMGGGMGGMGGLDLSGMAGLGGGMPGMGGMEGMAGMPGLEGMEISPEQMQQAMDEAMRLLSSGNLGDIMKNLQQMMGGMGGGMPGGLGGFGMEGAQGTPGMEALFAGFPGMNAEGWDDDEDGADAAESNDDEPDSAESDAADASSKDGDADGSGGAAPSGGKPA